MCRKGIAEIDHHFLPDGTYEVLDLAQTFPDSAGAARVRGSVIELPGGILLVGDAFGNVMGLLMQ